MLVYRLSAPTQDDYIFNPAADTGARSLQLCTLLVHHSSGQFLLSRINGDAPRASKLAAAFWIVREQAVINLKKPLL
jgi:hypothetical protein